MGRRTGESSWRLSTVTQIGLKKRCIKCNRVNSPDEILLEMIFGLGNTLMA